MGSLFFFVPALIVALPAVIMAHNVYTVRNWRRVQAQVLRTELRTMGTRGSGAVSHRPVVHYLYRVDGREYRSSVVTYGMESGGHRRWAQRILDRYPVGAEITVLHHPSRPEQACIRAVFGFFGWVLVVLAALLFALGLALAP